MCSLALLANTQIMHVSLNLCPLFRLFYYDPHFIPEENWDSGLKWFAQGLAGNGKCRIQIQAIRVQNPHFYPTLTCMPCCRTQELVMGPVYGSPLLLLRLGKAPRAAIFPFLAPVGTCILNSFSFPSGVDNLPLSHPTLPNLAKCRVPASVASFFFIDSEGIFVSSLWFKDFTVITMETQNKTKTHAKKRVSRNFQHIWILVPELMQ